MAMHVNPPKPVGRSIRAPRKKKVDFKTPSQEALKVMYEEEKLVDHLIELKINPETDELVTLAVILHGSWDRNDGLGEELGWDRANDFFASGTTIEPLGVTNQ